MAVLMRARQAGCDPDRVLDIERFRRDLGELILLALIRAGWNPVKPADIDNEIHNLISE